MGGKTGGPVMSDKQCENRGDGVSPLRLSTTVRNAPGDALEVTVGTTRQSLVPGQASLPPDPTGESGTVLEAREMPTDWWDEPFHIET